MKRYKLTPKAKEVLSAIGYLIVTGICATIGLVVLIALGILIAVASGAL